MIPIEKYSYLPSILVLMHETVETAPGPSGYKVLKNTIEQIRKTYNGLITVALPSNTSTIFMRKQFEEDSESNFALRFYSQHEIHTMLLTNSQTDFNFQKSNLIENIFELKDVADKTFYDLSSWLKINAIESTLAMLNGINNMQVNLLKSQNSLAFKCLDNFQKLRNINMKESKDSLNLDSIFGKIIVLTVYGIPDQHKIIVEKCNSNIHSLIIEKADKSHVINKITLYEDAYDEANAILDLALLESEKTSLSKMAIVVPDNTQKKLIISLAKSKNIPIAGSDILDAFNGQLILVARYLLNNKETLLNTHLCESFFSRFEWLRLNNNCHKELVSVLNKIKEATTLKDYFHAILTFIETGYINLIKDLSEVDIEHIEIQYSVLKQLSDSKRKIDEFEAIFLLNKICSPISKRLDTLGNGIYICKPKEIIGTSFSQLFITLFNVSYLNEEHEINSLLNNDEIETLGLQANTLQKNKNVNDSTINWLLNCSENTHISTSTYDGCKNKLLQNILYDDIISQNDPIRKMNINENTYIEITNEQEQADFYNELLSSEYNDKNILVEKNRINSFTATSLETLATCPFKFFITKALKGGKDNDNEDIDIMTALERGNLIHSSLEKVGLDKFDIDSLSIIVNEKISELLKQNIIPNTIAGTLNKIEVMKLIETCLILHKKKINQGSKIYSVEEKIDGTITLDTENIDIHGKVDRIDFNPDNSFSIIDYKSGKLFQSNDFFNFGKRLQLGIYACLLESKLNLKSIEYWYLNNPDGLIVNAEVNDELILKAKEMVKGIVSISKEGFIAPRNYSMEQKKLETKTAEKVEIDNCKNCDVSDICFSEHQEMWKSIHLIDEYKIATGDLEDLDEKNSI